MTVAERLAQAAEQIAADDQHGYSQPNRDGWGTHTLRFSDGTTYAIRGGDLDCSEMVRRCVNAALGREAIDWMWTGSEDEELRALGFVRLPFSGTAVRRGDVLWVQGHTGVALGGGMQADAHGDEVGGLSGPMGGDNTGHEVEVRALRPWTYIYRWEEDELTEADFARIQTMIDKAVDRAVERTPFAVWAYKNKRVEGVDVYQILRDIRNKLGIRDGQK